MLTVMLLMHLFVVQENEAYLSQMEAEGGLPAGAKLLKPVPSFCVELAPAYLSSASARKEFGKFDRIFINVCHSEYAPHHHSRFARHFISRVVSL